MIRFITLKLLSLYEDTVSALVYTQASQLNTNYHSTQNKNLGHEPRGRKPPHSSHRVNQWVKLIIEHQAAMPDFLVWPVRLTTLFIDFIAWPFYGHRFHKAPLQARSRILEQWRHSIAPVRDLVRFYDSLFVMARSADLSSPNLGVQHIQASISRNHSARSIFSPPTFGKISAEFVVVGSGPGGAVTAALLAESGKEVLLLEEGKQWSSISKKTRQTDETIPEFSYEEMKYKYRCAGLTPTFGRSKIAYVEGRCVGGGSDINSGLYHRTPPEILHSWADEFGLQEASPELMDPHFQACEETLHVSFNPGKLSLASLKLAEGANALGWESREVPRWFIYPKSGKGAGIKQTMSRTFLQRFLKAGGEIREEARVESIQKQNFGWRLNIHSSSGSGELHCARTVLAAGAVNTPVILRRSGLSELAGRHLQMHPTVKVTARFNEEVNHEEMGVPVHQVKQFAPDYSFGCSISSPPYLHLAMLDHPCRESMVEPGWKNMAIYYAMITPEGTGKVRPLPRMQDPLVTYSLNRRDLALLAKALRDLCKLLLNAGAVEVFPSVRGLGSFCREEQLSRIPNSLPKHTALMSVHLFSTCPMGENPVTAVTDSFGRVRGHQHLSIADASLLPSAPAVNPQGSVMAFARRNALHWLETG